MTIHPLQEADSTAQSTAYDTLWTGQEEVPVQESTGLERVMLAEDKLYVVLAVVLIIWIGLALLVFRTDRRLDRLERTMDERIAEKDTGA
ncbi:MAG: CcmD family protein [Rhodothermales bacterium]